MSLAPAGWLFAAYRHARRPGSLARDVAATAGTNAGLAVLGGLGGILLARALGPNDRGHLVALVQWPALACTLASVGVTQATTYRLGRHPARAKAIVATGTALCLASGVVVALAGPILAVAVGRSETVERYLTVLFLLAPMTIATGLWNSALQTLHIGRFNLTRAVQPLVYLAGTSVLFATDRLRLVTASITLGGAQVAAFIVAYVATRRSVPIGLRADRAEAGSLLRYGAVVFVGMLPRVVNVRLDLLVLSILPSVAPRELGVYVIAASLTWLVLPVAVSFGTVAFPRLARADDGFDRVQRVALRGSTGVALVLVAALVAGAPWVVPTVFGEPYRGAVRLVWLLAPGTVFLAFNQVMGDVLRGRGRPSFAVAGEATAAVVTITGLLLFVDAYGTTAAAVVSSVAYAATSVVLRMLLRKAGDGGPIPL